MTSLDIYDNINNDINNDINNNINRKIKKILMDETDVIYVVDNLDVVYISDGSYFYPFLASMTDIKRCFNMNENYYVYHSNIITVFNEGLYKLDSISNFWNRNNISEISYIEKVDVIITLENKNVYIYFGTSRKISLDIRSITQYYNNSIDHIKTCGNMLLIYQNSYSVKNNTNNYNSDPEEKSDLDTNVNDSIITTGKMYVYLIFNRNAKYMYNLSICEKLYENIVYYDDAHKHFVLNNGDILTLDGKNPSISFIEQLLNNQIYKESRIFITIKDNCLICLYDESRKSIIESLIKILPIEEIVTDKYTFGYIGTYLFPSNTNIKIINNKHTQIFIHNEKIYMISLTNDILQEIIFSDDKIDFSAVQAYQIKSNQKLFIDIDPSTSIVNQLINIIPQTYRLNNEKIYCFEQVNSQDIVLSYGEGVNRETYNILRIEIDDILKNKFSNMNGSECNKLGKLFYFCNKEGTESFSNIDPYFFYCMSSMCSNKINHILLLKNFKGDMFDLYHKQYLQYLNHPEQTTNFDMDIKNTDEYMKYLFTCELTEKQIMLYDEFISGFCYYDCRDKYRSIIVKFPVLFYLDKLIPSGYFNAELEFHKDSDLNVSFKDFEIFCKLFKKIFYKMAIDVQSSIVQNITGSHYYSDSIDIIYVYKHNTNFLTDSKHKAYHISTCTTTLFVDLPPVEELIENLLNLLSVEDKYMRN